MKKILLFAVCFLSIHFIQAQGTIYTDHINNNGNGSAIFQVHNTNAFDIIITDVHCHLGTATNNNVQLLYRTTPLFDYGAPWDYGTVGDGQNGWISAGTGTVVNSNTANGVVNALSGLYLIIPAGATYSLGFSATTMQYMSIPGGVNTFTVAGVELITGDGISWGGTAYPTTPSNYPRGLIGGITFIPGVPCTAPPIAGTTTANVNPICPSTNAILSLTGGTLGTGQTHQWQSSSDGINFTDIPGATNYNCIVNPATATYFRAIATCGGISDTSTPVLINMSPFMNCYCSSSLASSAIDEEIFEVTVNGGTTDPLYSNGNGCSNTAPGPGSILGRYSNFKTLPPITNISIGETINFSIAENECDGPTYYNNGMAMWIDFNQNGLFTDPGEQVYWEGGLTASPRTVSGSFVVPGSAVLGNTVMRVVVAEGYYGGSLTPCLGYGFGETEDYLINITCPTFTGPTGPDVEICIGSSAMITASSIPGATITWWDSLVGGTPLDTSNIYTTPTLTGNAIYSYYAQENLAGCPSGPRTQFDVIVEGVNVNLTPVNVTCNGASDGTFTLDGVTCGTAPFEYSINGGGFGPIPTNLLAGTYAIVTRDSLLATSFPDSIIIGEPGAPFALNVLNTTLFSATLEWTPQGSETQWTIEYGPTGFTPGLGTTITATAIPWTIYGLSDDTEYDFYVAAGCVPVSDFGGPYSFTTDIGTLAYNNDCGPGFIDISGTGTGLSLSDDASANITAGFPIYFRGTTTANLVVSNNGWVQHGSNYFGPWNLDLDDEEGDVYYETINHGGDNLFIVQWDHLPRYSSVIGQNVTFQIIFSENTGDVYYVYNDVVFGGTQSSNDYGASGSISTDGPTFSIAVSNNDPTYLTENSCVHFYSDLCPNITNFSSTVQQEDAMLDWDAGGYGETNWTLIYGPEGFDPTAVSSSAIDTFYLSSSDASFGGMLTQLTTYDVYIYSECQADSLTSDGYFYSFTTLPWCSDPSGLNAYTLIDTVDANWSWTETNPSYPATGFNLQYGLNGFDLYTGTIVPTNSPNLADTIADPGLLGGGIYQLYVQAVCGTDTSNYIGPVTFIMPITNDDACGAEALVVDGTLYTFNNEDATVALGEDTIAPPFTGAQTTTGWANTNLQLTTWFTFNAPASGKIRINNTGINYNGQVAVYTVTACDTFGTYTLIGANDDEIGGTSVAPNFTLCGLTPGATYYLLHDGYTNATGNYSISLTEIDFEAGATSTIGNICTGDDIDLFTTITGYDTGGVWSSNIPIVNAAIGGADFSSFALAPQVYDFEYTIQDGCAHDSVIAQVEIFALPNAGTDGTIMACRNQPINLLAGLSGSVDLNGTWYELAALPNSQITTSNTAGTYNYTYVAGNGICPDDTAYVTVTVQSCDFLVLDEEIFSHVTVYPNPSEGIVFVQLENPVSFDYIVTDAQGRIITRSNIGATDSPLVQLDLSLERAGVYFIHLLNDHTEKVFKVVIK